MRQTFSLDPGTLRLVGETRTTFASDTLHFEKMKFINETSYQERDSTKSHSLGKNGSYPLNMPYQNVIRNSRKKFEILKICWLLGPFLKKFRNCNLKFKNIYFPEKMQNFW